MKDEPRLPVRTVYYRDREAVRVIASGKPINAVANCIRAMRINKYEATSAEVYSTENGKLYAVIRNYLDRKETRILYEFKPTKDEREQQ
jgi:hypothetical protein